ncbi:MAG: GDP-mannose 4,6-dehydratase [Ginsengibacter sp.]
MRILITGFSGFVSHHFLDFLESMHIKFIVLGTDKNIPLFEFTSYKNLQVSFKHADLLNKEIATELINEFHPEYLLHLASSSSVANSWRYPIESINNNLNIFLNLVDAIRLNNIKCRILSIGSSEEYGNVAPHQLPLTEENNLKPVSPYAVARVSQEMLSKIYADGYGLDIVITRSFNHIGPRQKDIFVISSFAKQLVTIANDASKPNRLTTGDISIVRDFVDVRDVVKAYYLLFMNGKSGEIYNICTGIGISLKEIINKMCFQLNIHIELLTDKNLIRPQDNKLIIGSYQKIKQQIGWAPTISIDDSLHDIISYWNQNIRAAQ